MRKAMRGFQGLNSYYKPNDSQRPLVGSHDKKGMIESTIQFESVHEDEYRFVLARYPRQLSQLLRLTRGLEGEAHGWIHLWPFRQNLEGLA